jgi:hypothetical protein
LLVLSIIDLELSTTNPIDAGVSEVRGALCS